MLDAKTMTAEEIADAMQAACLRLVRDRRPTTLEEIGGNKLLKAELLRLVSTKGYHNMAPKCAEA